MIYMNKQICIYNKDILFTIKPFFNEIVYARNLQLICNLEMY